jgi:hypothetical protein
VKAVLRRTFIATKTYIEKSMKNSNQESELPPKESTKITN